MEDEEARVRAEKVRRDQESASRVVARRNDEASVKSAKERYLERKRRRLEEASGEGQPEQPDP